MDGLPLGEKSVLVAGAVARMGRALAIACARARTDVFARYGGSEDEASETQRQITAMGRHAWILQCEIIHVDRGRHVS